MSKRKGSRSRRLQTDPYIKAASHPTRQTILKSLQENDALTTIQLQELTGEDRYNLYHHLAKLQDAGLVDYELEDSRAKRYFLSSDEDTVERFFYLERSDSKARRIISELLMVLAGSSESTLPGAEDVESVSVIFRLRKQ
ncbi:MAG: winged helix-turn-helix domain-containing protein [Anaerolineales bacterium]